MNKKKINLAGIKTKDLDETSSFTDLMTIKERKNREKNITQSNDIDDMINEKRKNTKELAKELEKAKEEYNSKIIDEVNITKKNKKKETVDENEEKLGKTQILELTRQMKFNFEDVKNENSKKKNRLTLLNIVGILNLICICFYIYLLTFSNYQDNQTNYLIVGSIIVLLVLFFGISVISGKKLRKVFNIFNIITILTFIAFNIYILIY